ncbi:MAG TPA: hypothetical protein VNS02_10495 [Rhizobiaceae bacterium]|nr:hypothetical protein [Rhizobiaceae bacterium]
MSDSLVNYIDAKFGGQDRRFQILREDAHIVERTLGKAAYQTFLDLAEGRWWHRDVEIILSSGLGSFEEPEGPSIGESLGRLSVAFGNPPVHVDRRFYREDDDVIACLREHGAAKYAPLALKLLEALIFGITPADATFDENATEAA